MSHGLRAHGSLLWLFARRCIVYNLALSILGASALFAISLASAEADAPLAPVALRGARTAALMAAILVMSGGHAMALIAMRLFHKRELPYYRNAGLGEAGLSVGAWIVALVVGGGMLAGGLVWL